MSNELINNDNEIKNIFDKSSGLIISGASCQDMVGSCLTLIIYTIFTKYPIFCFKKCF